MSGKPIPRHRGRAEHHLSAPARRGSENGLGRRLARMGVASVATRINAAALKFHNNILSLTLRRYGAKAKDIYRVDPARGFLLRLSSAMLSQLTCRNKALDKPLPDRAVVKIVKCSAAHRWAPFGLPRSYLSRLEPRYRTICHCRPVVLLSTKPCITHTLQLLRYN